MRASDHSLEQRIEQVVHPLARALEVDLIEVMCLGKGAGSCIRVTIDKPGGVGIEDCEHLHLSLSRALDVLDPLPHSYRLEVSSPGLDRPLKHLKDYQRSLHQLVRLWLRQPQQGQSTVVGYLQDVSDAGVCITRSASQAPDQGMHVVWDMIAKAKREVEF